MIRRFFNFLLLFFLSTNLLAQENDFQFWSTFSVDKKLDKATNVYLKHSLRFRENASILSKSFTDVRIKFKHNKKWSFAVGFRDINEWNKEIQKEQRNRYYSDIYFSKKLDRLNTSVRNRLQYQGNDSEYIFIFRQKLTLTYNIRKTKFDPDLSIEYFYNREDKINKMRYTFGLSYPLSKDLDLELAYRIQQALNASNPETLFIFEGKLSYDL